jgi:phage-related minor tail protein
MVKTAVWVAAALALVCLGGGFLWAAYQLGRLLQQARFELLPHVTEVVRSLRGNLDQLETLTRNADETVQDAHEIVAVAQRGVKSAEQAAGDVRRLVVRGGSVHVMTVMAGVAAGWRAFRGRKTPRTSRSEDVSPVVVQAVPEVKAAPREG